MHCIEDHAKLLKSATGVVGVNYEESMTLGHISQESSVPEYEFLIVPEPHAGRVGASHGCEQAGGI